MKFLILVMLFSFSFAKTITAYYNVGYGFFDTVAKAKAVIELNKNNYHIKIEAKTAGFMTSFTNRFESFESFGEIKEGEFIPQVFINYRTDGETKKKKTYKFNHQTKKVFLTYEKDKDGKKSASTKKMKYYAKDDLLTLFFSLKKLLDKNKATQKAYAMGANKKDGHLDIILPDEKKKKTFLELFNKKKGNFIIAIIYRKIFLSSKGELIINLNNDYLCQEAVLKDVLFYGDIVGTLEKIDIDNSSAQKNN